MATRRIGFTLAFVLISTLVAHGRELRFASPIIAGVKTNIVVVDLNNRHLDVRPVVAGKPPCYMPNRYRTFAALVKITKCLAAINGTYFDPRTASTLGSMVYEGQLVHQGYVGNAVAVDRLNRPHFIKLTHNAGAGVDWTPYRFAIAAGPTLVNGGRIVVSARGEGFHDPHIFRPARRSAIGFRDNGDMILMTVAKPVSLHKLATIMRGLGARIALNLDGGGSSALYYRGKWVTKPRGKLTNILAIVPRNDEAGQRFELVDDALRASERGDDAP